VCYIPEAILCNSFVWRPDQNWCRNSLIISFCGSEMKEKVWCNMKVVWW